MFVARIACRFPKCSHSELRVGDRFDKYTVLYSQTTPVACDLTVRSFVRRLRTVTRSVVERWTSQCTSIQHGDNFPTIKLVMHMLYSTVYMYSTVDGNCRI